MAGRTWIFHTKLLNHTQQQFRHQSRSQISCCDTVEPYWKRKWQLYHLQWVLTSWPSPECCHYRSDHHEQSQCLHYLQLPFTARSSWIFRYWYDEATEPFSDYQSTTKITFILGIHCLVTKHPMTYSNKLENLEACVRYGLTVNIVASHLKCS